MFIQPKFNKYSRFLPILKKVKELSNNFVSLTGLQLKEKTKELQRLVVNGSSLDDILPQAFALVDAACVKSLSLELTEDNLLSGILFHLGYVVELTEELDSQTGFVLAAYLNALSGKNVHIALTNEFIASRDCDIAAKIYTLLGLNVGLSLPNFTDYESKRRVYQSDIIYSTSNQFAVDLLINESEPEDKKFIKRESGFLLVDSADEILIDLSEAKFVLPNKPDATNRALTMKSFLRSYSKLAGAASAAVQESKNFKMMYGLEVAQLHPQSKIVRKDFPNVFCKTEVIKYRHIVQEVIDVQEYGRPVIIGIANYEDANLLSIMLSKKKIVHTILSEENQEQRIFTLANAGKKNAVTILSGESFIGVRIPLGGVPTLLADKVLVERGMSRNSPAWDRDYKKVLQEQTNLVVAECEELASKGGLHVIGTTLYSTSRLDSKFRQLANNCGTTGSSKFFISLEDNFLKSIGMERIIDIVNSFTTNKEVLVVHPFWSKFVTYFIDIARNDFLRENPNPMAYLIQKDESGYVVAKNKPFVAEKIGRNDPCPCGSGKKYKKCCGA